MKSYNAKNWTNADYTTNPTLDASYLYVPRTEIIGGCHGYWLASPNDGITDDVWRVDFGGHVFSSFYHTRTFGVRPVVCLSSDINVVKNGNLWTIEK